MKASSPPPAANAAALDRDAGAMPIETHLGEIRPASGLPTRNIHQVDADLHLPASRGQVARGTAAGEGATVLVHDALELHLVAVGDVVVEVALGLVDRPLLLLELHEELEDVVLHCGYGPDARDVRDEALATLEGQEASVGEVHVAVYGRDADSELRATEHAHGHFQRGLRFLEVLKSASDGRRTQEGDA